MRRNVRVAFLPDTFHEINGVAHTARQLQAFAVRKEIPFLSIHCGPTSEACRRGSVDVLQLRRGPLSFDLDTELHCDPFLFRYLPEVLRSIRSFGAELIHITGPGDMGCLGAVAAWKLKLPLVISWHTNLHEYAGERIRKLLHPAGERLSSRVAPQIQSLSLQFLHWFYRKGHILFAPNHEIGEFLGKVTNRPVFLMSRGVDTELFAPGQRARTDAIFRIGYVGRLTAEKNVHFLAQLGQALVSAGYTNFEFQIIGQGRDEEWLRQHVPCAVMRGVLLGEELARAYANMDLFVFPSKTDTFGNVVLEALSSGVPVIVTSSGGPKFLVDDGKTGFVARSEDEFVAHVQAVLDHRVDLPAMRAEARSHACRHSWDDVFDDVFAAYHKCLSRSHADAENRRQAQCSDDRGRHSRQRQKLPATQPPAGRASW